MWLACELLDPHGKIQLQISGRTVREQESMAVLIANIGTIFVPRTLPHRRILFQRSLQRPQACSLLWPGPHRDTHHYGQDRTGTLITMAGTAPGPRWHTHYYGRTALRRSLLWPGPHRDAVYYGRDRTGTLITMAGTAPGPRWHTHCYGRDRTRTQFTMVAGTAPGRSLLWPGPHRDRADTLITMAGTAPGRSLLWPGPHRDADCYGRDRHTVWTLQSNLKGVGGWMASSTFASFCLSSRHKAITLYLRPAPKRCFTTHFVCIRFLRVLQMLWWCKASTTNQVRVQSGRGTLPISLCMASMHAHVECKPWAGIFDSLTWAPAHFLALEMVPFFPDKKALHPCTLTVY